MKEDKLCPAAIRAIRNGLMRKIEDSNTVLLDLVASARELQDLGLVVSRKNPVFSSDALAAGVPDIRVRQSDLVLQYLRKGNMYQLCYDEETGIYQQVVFILGKTIYFASTTCLFLRYYTLKDVTDDKWQDLANWKILRPCKKRNFCLDEAFYLTANIGPRFISTTTLDGKPCGKYNMLRNPTISIKLYRLWYFIFHPSIDIRLMHDCTINHKIANSFCFDEFIRDCDCFELTDFTNHELYIILITHPLFLEACSREVNTQHGHFVTANNLRAIPVSVDDMHLSREEIIEKGIALWNLVLTLVGANETAKGEIIKCCVEVLGL